MSLLSRFGSLCLSLAYRLSSAISWSVREPRSGREKRDTERLKSFRPRGNKKRVFESRGQREDREDRGMTRRDARCCVLAGTSTHTIGEPLFSGSRPFFFIQRGAASSRSIGRRVRRHACVETKIFKMSLWHFISVPFPGCANNNLLRLLLILLNLLDLPVSPSRRLARFNYFSLVARFRSYLLHLSLGCSEKGKRKTRLPMLNWHADRSRIRGMCRRASDCLFFFFFSSFANNDRTIRFLRRTGFHSR